jgi:hypothetical protein
MKIISLFFLAMISSLRIPCCECVSLGAEIVTRTIHSGDPIVLDLYWRSEVHATWSFWLENKSYKSDALSKTLLVGKSRYMILTTPESLGIGSHEIRFDSNGMRHKSSSDNRNGYANRLQ